MNTTNFSDETILSKIKQFNILNAIADIKLLFRWMYDKLLSNESALGNFIPLTGTTESNPVTNPIEMTEDLEYSDNDLVPKSYVDTQRPYKVYAAKFKVSDNSGNYIFTLEEVYEGDFTGFSFSTLEYPDRFVINAPQGTFSNKELVFIELITSTGTKCFSSIIDSSTPDTIKITELYKSLTNGTSMTFINVPKVGSPTYYGLEIRVYE